MGDEKSISNNTKQWLEIFLIITVISIIFIFLALSKMTQFSKAKTASNEI